MFKTEYVAPLVSERQPDVILRQRGRGRLRTDEVVEFGELDSRAELALVGEFVQHRGHPPREAHRLPDPRQRGRRIIVDAGRGFFSVIFPERTRQIMHVAGGEVQPLGASDVHYLSGAFREYY